MNFIQIGKSGYNLDSLKNTTKSDFKDARGDKPNWESHWKVIEKELKKLFKSEKPAKADITKDSE